MNDNECDSLAYKTCPCWSIVPGKSQNCLNFCSKIQQDLCTEGFNKDNES